MLLCLYFESMVCTFTEMPSTKSTKWRSLSLSLSLSPPPLLGMPWSVWLFLIDTCHILLVYPLFCAEPGSAKSIRWSKRYGRTSATSKPADLKPLAVKSGYCKLKRTAPNAMVIKAIFDEKVWFKTFSTRDGSTKGSMKSAKSGQRFRKTVPERPCLNPFAVN